MSDAADNPMKAKDDLIETLQKQVDGLKAHIETLEQEVSSLSNHTEFLGQHLDDSHRRLVEVLALVQSHHQLVIEGHTKYEAVIHTYDDSSIFTPAPPSAPGQHQNT